MEDEMRDEARKAAERLRAYFSLLSTNAEVDYPDGYDPAEDAELVSAALKD
jgi:hypothetical protein